MTEPRSAGDRPGDTQRMALRDGSGVRCSPWPAHASPEHPCGVTLAGMGMWLPLLLPLPGGAVVVGGAEGAPHGQGRVWGVGRERPGPGNPQHRIRPEGVNDFAV